MSHEAEIVRIPAWERYEWLRHGFSMRRGGVSTVYGGKSLNLGWTKEDEPGLVAENRRCFVRSVGGDLHGKDGTAAGWNLVTLRQVHSARVHAVGKEVQEGPLETRDGKAVLEGDGLMTDVPGMLLAVGTADCVPVLVVDVEKRMVAAFHAGWRGTAAGIVESGVAKMREEYGSRVEDLIAAVGPSIGACCYAVGEEVRAAFRERFAYAEELFRREGSAIYVDLWEANRRQLKSAGVEKVWVVGECTACTVSGGERKYFSHRADKGVAGRMLSAVGVSV